MIFVDRQGTINNLSIEPDQAWYQTAGQLTARAIQEGTAHVVTDHYRHDQVKMALEKLFHDKCAYCEGDIGSQGPWDVEHYRPKGSVKENNNHHGYYWLAYTWENLLPSCAYCNQRRKDAPTFDDPATLPAAGKLDQFPLEDETCRAMAPNDPLDLEKPLLLNPCMDRDCETYFIYDPQGYIQPSGVKPGREYQRADKTIRICHLNRRRLRKQRAREMETVIKAVKALELAVQTGANAQLLQLLQGIVQDLTADKRRFAGAARFIDRNPHLFLAPP